jgi:hypothetical protein
MHAVDLSNVPDVDDGKTCNDLRAEIVLMEDKAKQEDDRVSKLLLGCGRGRGKSPEFEFAARTVLATGCSSRAAKDNLLVGARLFLPPDKYAIFETQVSTERWFRVQRKGLGYEAWLHSMIRLGKCESILQWEFDETRCCRSQYQLLLLHVTSTTPLSSLDGTPTLNQWLLVDEGTSLPTVITIECSGLLVGSTFRGNCRTHSSFVGYRS